MSQKTGSLQCQLGCWITGAVVGLIAAIAMIVVSDISVIGSVFLAGVLAVVLGAVLSWLLCRPLPAPAESQSRETEKAVRAPRPAQDPALAPRPAPAAGPEPVADAAPEPIGGSVIEDEHAARHAAEPEEGVSVPSGDKPAGLEAAREGGPDNLKEIKGVGPKLETLLNRMGYYHFDQIAAWTDREVGWVDKNLKGFKGRVSRDNWVAQAKLLASGGETEFSEKVKDGDVY